MEEVNDIQNEGDANNSTVATQVAPLGADAIYGFLDTYHEEKWSLKALVEITTDPSLDVFERSDSSQFHVDDLRLGIRQLFELCLKRQDEIIDGLEERVKNSPEEILREAKSVSGIIDRGCPHSVWHQRGLEVLKRLQALTSLSNIDDYPEATALKNLLLSKMGHKKDNNSCDMLTGTDG